MSEPKTTIEEVNAELGAIGCCTYPVWGLPSSACRMKIGFADAEDSDFDEDINVTLPLSWQSGVWTTYDTTINVTASGYAYAQFLDPGGDPENELPALYRAFLTHPAGTALAGQVSWQYEATNVFGDPEQSLKATFVSDGDHVNQTGTLTVHYWHTDTQNRPEATYTDIFNNHQTEAGYGRHTHDNEFVFKYDISFYRDIDPECTPTTVKRDWKKLDGNNDTMFSPGGNSGPYTDQPTQHRTSLGRESWTHLELFDPITKDELVSAAQTQLTGGDWLPGSDCEARTLINWPKVGATRSPWPPCTQAIYYSEPDSYPIISGGTVSLRKIEETLRVPLSHTGSYYRVKVDIGEYPEGWDSGEPDAPVPFIVTADIEKIWEEPGDPEDPTSWKFDPIEIEPPTSPGIRKLVNGRCWGYRGTKTGLLPRKFLEELDFDNPPEV